MKDELLKKLDRISDLEDRRLLKNILLNAFDSIIDHNMAMYETLEKNIYNEIEDAFEKYYIYTTVDKIENIDPISNFYHPMYEEDKYGSLIDFEVLIENLNSDNETIITTLFMEMNYIELKKMLEEKRQYTCTIITDNEVYSTKVHILRSNKYLKKIEELYRIFQFNEKDWKTVNSGFAYKFIDVIIDEKIEINANETIKEITLDFNEYEKYKRPNYIMMWNIQNIEVDDKSFPKPLKDSIHHEHSLNIEQEERNCGFLVNTNHDYIKYIKQMEESIIIANNTDKQDVWSIVKIEDMNNNIRKNNVDYEEQTNNPELGFIGRFANEKALIVRTQGELARLFESYDLSNELKFNDIEIVENYSKDINTVDFDYFLDNNLRDDPKRSFMVLKFICENKEDFLLYEKLSFFVSIAGLMFPEYKCVGEVE